MIKITNRSFGTLVIGSIGKELNVGECYTLPTEILTQDINDLVSYGLIRVEITKEVKDTEDKKTKK